jgi:UDPglucose--hexose-1-phosphate uridylyltransferase
MSPQPASTRPPAVPAGRPVLLRHDLRHADGRRLYVYGSLRGHLPDEEGPPEPPALEQRLDLLTDAWVAVSPARNRRPSGGEPETNDVSSGCPVCPGGPEVPFPFDAAVFENRFPTFVADPPPVGADPRVAPALGRCEVVLYTPEHEGSLATLSPEALARVVAVWRDRSRALYADPALVWAMIFENRGEAVGATLSHPHGQIYAFDRLPPTIERRAGVLAASRRRDGSCLNCRVVATDDVSSRVVAANAHFTVAVPFAARWPFEVHVRARRHGLRRLDDLEPDEQLALAAALRGVILRYDGLYTTEFATMMVIHEAPRGAPDDAADWHLSVEFYPPQRSAEQLKVRASVETAAGTFINDTLPEASASQLAAVGIRVPDEAGPPVVVLMGER